MSSRRTIILVASIVVAALATYVLFNYIKGVEARSKPNPVTVYMISEEIKRGTPGADVKQTAIAKKVIPAEFRPETFVGDLGVLDGKVAVIDLKPNQILVDGMFVPGERLNTTFKDKITGDNVAVALAFESTRAVGGYVKPGDEVNLLMVKPAGGGGGSAGATGTGAATPTTRPGQTGSKSKITEFRLNELTYQNDVRYFYQKVRILAIGSDVLKSPGETAAAPKTGTAAAEAGPGGGGVIVFLVPPDVAQRLLAVSPGELFMTLPSETWKPVPIAPIADTEFDWANPLPAEDAKRLTPYGPNGYVDQTAVRPTGSTGTPGGAAPGTTVPSGPSTTKGN